MWQLRPGVLSRAAVDAGAGAGGGSDPHFANVVLLAGFEGADAATSATDESSSAKALTFNGNAQLDTAQKKFGTSSLLLDGTNDFVSLADHADWHLGSNQFTIECWVRLSTIKSSVIIGQAYDFAANWSFELGVDGNNDELEFWIANAGGSGTQVLLNPSWVRAVNTWYHIAIDCDATGKVRLYVDGVMLASGTRSAAVYNSTELLRIGRQGSSGPDFAGWIDEVRITNGVARYASDGGFTVPTSAFPRS